MPYVRPYPSIRMFMQREFSIKKAATRNKRDAPPSLLAEVSPQLLHDMRKRSAINDTGESPDRGLDLLEDMKDRLSLEGREMQRMEDEGGPPLKPIQEVKANACLKASQRIKAVLRAAHNRTRARKLTPPG